MNNKFHFAGMTQPEFQACMSEDPVILVPMGSIENQGPQTFMGDYLCAERLAELIAARANGAGMRTIISPTLPFGCWDYFAGAPGGITLRPEIFPGVVRDILNALVNAGSQRILILNGHSGNVEPIFEVTNYIYMSSGLIIPSLYIWKAAYQIWAAEDDHSALNSAGHGANPLGSVAMHMFPELIRRDLVGPPIPRGRVMDLPITGLASVRFGAIEVEVPVGIPETSVDGLAGGDMRACSPELGALLTDALVEVGTKLVAHIAHLDLETHRSQQ